MLARYADGAGHARLAQLAFRVFAAEHLRASQLCARVCANLLADLPEPTVLELGFGAGAALADLRRLRPDVRLLGADICGAAQRMAEERLRRVGVELMLDRCGRGRMGRNSCWAGADGVELRLGMGRKGADVAEFILGRGGWGGAQAGHV